MVRWSRTGVLVETVANGDSGVEVTGEQEGRGSPAISIQQEFQSNFDRERRKTNERERWKGSTKRVRRGLKTWVQVYTKKRTRRRFHVCGLRKNKRTANTNVCALSARRRHKRLQELFSEKQTPPKTSDMQNDVV